MAQEDRSHPFRLAFTFAMAAVVLCTAGIAGYDLGKRALLLADTDGLTASSGGRSIPEPDLPLPPCTSGRRQIESPNMAASSGRDSYPTIINR